MTQPSLYLALPWAWDIRYSQEDDCWLATVAEFPDFFAAGKTAGEAAGNARDALISHIAGYAATGRPIPDPIGRRDQRIRSAAQAPEANLVFA